MQDTVRDLVDQVSGLAKGSVAKSSQGAGAGDKAAMKEIEKRILGHIETW